MIYVCIWVSWHCGTWPWVQKQTNLVQISSKLVLFYDSEWHWPMCAVCTRTSFIIDLLIYLFEQYQTLVKAKSINSTRSLWSRARRWDQGVKGLLHSYSALQSFNSVLQLFWTRNRKDNTQRGRVDCHRACTVMCVERLWLISKEC